MSRSEEPEYWYRRVRACARIVHGELGPGFLELIYEQALCVELIDAGVPFRRQHPLVVGYRDVEVGLHRLDLLVADCLVVELKALGAVHRNHRRVVRSYLRAGRFPLGLLLNFGTAELQIQRVRP